MGEALGARWRMLARLAVSAAMLGLVACSGGGGGDDGGGGGGNRGISGTVTDVSGNPVAGAIVTIAGISTQTGQNGNYSISGLPNTGDLNFTVTATGFTTVQGTITDTTQASLPIQMTATGGGGGGGGGGGSRVLSGRVTDANSSLAIIGATVGAAGRTTTTTNTGNYTLTGLPDTGALTVTFTAPNYQTLSQVVTDDALTTLNAQLQPTGGGPGDVTQPPPPPDFDSLRR